MRLKATKTSLYNLIAEDAEIFLSAMPLMKYTEFYKSFRHSSYSLDWHIDGTCYHAFFAACMGKPLLSITAKCDGREVSRDVYNFTVQELRERGMIDEEKGVAANRD